MRKRFAYRVQGKRTAVFRPRPESTYSVRRFVIEILSREINKRPVRTAPIEHGVRIRFISGDRRRILLVSHRVNVFGYRRIGREKVVLRVAVQQSFQISRQIEAVTLGNGVANFLFYRFAVKRYVVLVRVRTLVVVLVRKFVVRLRSERENQRCRNVHVRRIVKSVLGGYLGRIFGFVIIDARIFLRKFADVESKRFGGNFYRAVFAGYRGSRHVHAAPMALRRICRSVNAVWSRRYYQSRGYCG